MRRVFLYFISPIIYIVILTACNNNGSSRNTQDSSASARDSFTSGNDSQSGAGDGVPQQKTKKAQVVPTPLNLYQIMITLPDTMHINGRILHPRALAKECVDAFQRGGVQSRPFTTSVSFDQKKFQQWVDSMEGADSISIELGLYSQRFIDTVNALRAAGRSDELNVTFPQIDRRKRGRLSVFLFAYKGVDSSGKPAEYYPGNNVSSAYNLGNLHP